MNIPQMTLDELKLALSNSSKSNLSNLKERHSKHRHRHRSGADIVTHAHDRRSIPIQLHSQLDIPPPPIANLNHSIPPPSPTSPGVILPPPSPSSVTSSSLSPPPPLPPGLPRMLFILIFLRFGYIASFFGNRRS